MGRRGSNQTSYALYEELGHLKVSAQAPVPYIYKRQDKQVHLPVEERTYQHAGGISRKRLQLKQVFRCLLRGNGDGE